MSKANYTRNTAGPHCKCPYFLILRRCLMYRSNCPLMLPNVQETPHSQNTFKEKCNFTKTLAGRWHLKDTPLVARMLKYILLYPQCHYFTFHPCHSFFRLSTGFFHSLDLRMAMEPINTQCHERTTKHGGWSERPRGRDIPFAIKEDRSTE